jgi:hypothetical protein
MNRLKKAFKKAVFCLYVLKANLKLSYLAPQNQSAKLLKTALRQTLSNKLASDEKRLIEKIESLRKTLNSSKAEVKIADFGAGSSTSTKTLEQMDNGQILIKKVGDICRLASKSYFWSVLLFKIIRAFKPSSCLELGTCLGISASYQASALKLNNKGRLFTLEGAQSLASLAKENFQILELDNVNIVVGRFNDTLEKVLQDNKPIDYAFIDGHHDQYATLNYFNQIYPYLSNGAVIIFDDISWSKGMKIAWQTIKSDQRIGLYIDLFAVGLCIIKKEN